MSKRPLLSRPRTKVYETNYNIGESYYRPALDGIDRKYGRFGGLDRGSSTNGDIFGVRAPSLPTERPMELPSPRTALRDMEEDEFFGDMPRRRPNSALLGEFDSIFEGRVRNGMAKERTPMRGGRTLDDEIEEDITSSMKRLRALKGSRSIVDELDDMESSFSSKKDSRMRQRVDFSDKVMDSVGLTSKARAALEEDGSTTGRRRFLKMTSDAGDGEELTKWTALKPSAGRRLVLGEEEDMSLAQSAAAARAMKSRARLDDLESEMQALSERSAAREKRVRDLKALVQENEANAIDNLQTTVRVKSSIQSEKKTVTF